MLVWTVPASDAVWLRRIGVGFAPSRRNRAPISPTSVQRSAAAKILRLSPLENYRRLAVAATSGSVAGGARAECGAYIETVL